jgi:phage terminase large subunit-like protein
MKTMKTKTKFNEKQYTKAEIRRHSEIMAKITPNGDELLKQGCWFDLNAARRVSYFFKSYLVHTNGRFEGKAFKLARWQRRQVVYPLFGWMRRNERGEIVRAFRTLFLYIPKKNGKSTLCAGMLIYLLCFDGEKSAKVFAAAGDKEQAGIIFEEVVNMIKASKLLKKKMLIRESYKWIKHKKTNSKFRALSSEAKTKEGLNASAYVVDEVHILPNDHLTSTLQYSGRARLQPLAFMVTTAGNDIHLPWYDIYKYAKKVLSGQVKDTTFLPVIFEIEQHEDFEDRKLWFRANPSLGTIFTLEDMEADYRKAKENPREFASFLRYLLNYIVTDLIKPLDSRIWLKAAEADSEYLLKREAYGGLDLASTRDMCSFCLVFPFKDFYAVRHWYWVPKHIKRNRERSVIEKYEQWAEERWLKFTDSEVVDYDVIFEDIMMLSELYRIKQINVDKSHNAMHIIPRLMKEGLKVTGFPQSIFAYNSPCKEFEVLYQKEKIRNDGNPITAWNIDNVIWKEDENGRVMPSREASKEKIDGFVAMMMGLAIGIQKVMSRGKVKERGIAYVE